MSNRRHAIVIAGLGALVGLTVAALPAVGSSPLFDSTTVVMRSGAPAQPTSAGRMSPCTAALTTTLSASSLQLCESAEVAVSVDPFCPVCASGIRVVFVQIDKAFEAPWMNAQAVQALEELQRSDMVNEMKVAVVHYNSGSVTTRQRMTPNLMQARGALMEPPYGHDPFGDVEGAANEALRLLRDERAGGSRTGEPECEFIIFFASSKNIFPDMGQAMERAANSIHRERVTLFVGCPETHDDYCDYTREMPRSLANYTEALEGGRLRNMVRNAMRAFDDEPTMRRLELNHAVPLGLEVVKGSFSQPPTTIVTNTEMEQVEYMWRWQQLRNTDPHTLTYRVQPLAIGTFGLRTSMTLVDENNLSRVTAMSPMTVAITGECPSLETETPTPTLTSTPVPTPTNTPTPLPEPIYLPIVIGERCTVQWVYSDVALVIDMSTSMDRPTQDGGVAKDIAAMNAAKAFLDMMDFTPNHLGQNDQVAVVGFNREAWIASPLGNDPDALRAAIDALPERQDQFTRLDLALEWGAKALDPALVQEGNKPVIVMLTDGLPNQVPYAEDGTMETTILRAATAAKGDGAVVYTVGLGAPGDINAALLAEAATSPDHYYYAPAAEDLSNVYSQIAYSFGCPRGRHSWNEPWP